jgi:hypothetical protein
MNQVNYTDLEKLVFNKALDICFEEPEATVKELAKYLLLEVNVVKGVVGSLVKKNVLAVDEEERGTKMITVGKKVKYVPVMFLSVRPIIEGKEFGYGWDYYTVEEKNKLYI